MQCNIVCNGTLSLGQGRLVGMHDCSSAPIVLLVEHARAAGTSRDMGTRPTIFWLFRFLWYECYLTTIPVELGFLWHFEVLKLKTCSLYHEKLFIRKFNDLITQVL